MKRALKFVNDHRKRKKLQSTKLLRNDGELVGTGRVEDLGIA